MLRGQSAALARAWLKLRYQVFSRRYDPPQVCHRSGIDNFEGRLIPGHTGGEEDEGDDDHQIEPGQLPEDIQRVALLVTVAGSEAAAWSYPQPVAPYAELRDHVAFYPQRVDACYLDDERVQTNGGDFYGGWITADIGGPFKGGPGTAGW